MIDVLLFELAVPYLLLGTPSTRLHVSDKHRSYLCMHGMGTYATYVFPGAERRVDEPKRSSTW